MSDSPDSNQSLTENGFTVEFEKSVLKAEQEGGGISFDSVDELIAYSRAN